MTRTTDLAGSAGAESAEGDWVTGTTAMAEKVPGTRARRLGAAMLCALAFTAAAGCAVEPWVKPYERDRIADPIMSWDRDPVSSAYMHHVYDAREGARGATGSSGGGCGCN